MSEQVQVQPLTITSLTMAGDPEAAVCEGEFCEIPAHPEQGIVNRRLDDDAV